MPNDYLVACHRFISAALDRSEAMMQRAESCGDNLQAAFHAGQVEELSALRQYMTDHFDLATQRYY